MDIFTHYQCGHRYLPAATNCIASHRSPSFANIRLFSRADLLDLVIFYSIHKNIVNTVLTSYKRFLHPNTQSTLCSLYLQEYSSILIHSQHCAHSTYKSIPPSSYIVNTVLTVLTRVFRHPHTQSTLCSQYLQEYSSILIHSQHCAHSTYKSIPPSQYIVNTVLTYKSIPPSSYLVNTVLTVLTRVFLHPHTQSTLCSLTRVFLHPHTHHQRTAWISL